MSGRSGSSRPYGQKQGNEKPYDQPRDNGGRDPRRDARRDATIVSLRGANQRLQALLKKRDDAKLLYKQELEKNGTLVPVLPNSGQER